MMNSITPEQRLALAEVGGSPIELANPQTGDAFVLVRADVDCKMRDQIEDREAQRDREAWSKLARKAWNEWAAENPF